MIVLTGSQGRAEARAQREGGQQDGQVADQDCEYMEARLHFAGLQGLTLFALVEREGHEHPVPGLQADFPPDHQGSCVRYIQVFADGFSF